MATQEFGSTSARLGASLGRGLAGAAENIGHIVDERISRMQAQAEQQRQRDMLGSAYEKIGLDRALAYMPESVQKQAVNQFLVQQTQARQQEQRAGTYSEFGVPQEHASLLARFRKRTKYRYY